MTDRTVTGETTAAKPVTHETTTHETTTHETTGDRVVTENAVTEHPEADEVVTTHAEPAAPADRAANADRVGSQPPLATKKKHHRVDLVALVAGLICLVIAFTALADRLWVAVDTVLVLGGLTMALGVAMVIGTLRRNLLSPQRDR